MKKVDNGSHNVVALKIWLKLMAFALGAWTLLRIVLAMHPLTEASSLNALQWVGTIVIGAVNDAFMMALFMVPLMAFLMASGHWRFKRPQAWWILAALALLWAWITFGFRQLHEFNGSLARVLSWVVVYWIASFALRAFLPRVRARWMQVWTAVFIFIYLCIFILDLFGEWLFWDEFGVRYNFIAVDYLVYTGEVVGNIMQSYSMGWILTGVVLLAAATEWLLLRHEIARADTLYLPGWRWKAAGVTFIPALLALAMLPATALLRRGDNVWFNQLQANGAYSFVEAFMANRLDYSSFYNTLPPDQVASILADQLSITPVDSAAVDSPRRPNIVLITMESMSADYMQRFGNEEHLTPVLDSLWTKSLAFDRLFAAGNRTVRGLEALTLSRPPAPGESIIKRPDDDTVYPSIADKLKAMGYSLAFYYGGDSYFDNMEQFFSGLGYSISDRKTMTPEMTTCATVWGACDGDVYRRIIADMDTCRRPAFIHMMTTSNHRPYIYPEGCVSIPPTAKSRLGAVMYADYALGQFLNEAAHHSWADNTIFVIVADHCASSAGSTELPIEKYHIPALIYAPGMVDARVVDTTASQVDIFPTLFALLGWEPDSRLYGRDILSPGFKPRAFIATYQDLGYLSNDTLTVLSPGRKVRQFVVDPTPDNPYSLTQLPDTESPAPSAAATHLNRAISFYQSSAAQ